MPALLQKLMGAGVPAGLAVAMGDDLEDNATAAGTTQSDAKKIYTATVRFTTVASGAGAILPDGSRGDSILVVNDGANALNLYPPVGHTIDDGAMNAALSIAAGSSLWLDRVTRLKWVSGNSGVVSSARVTYNPSGTAPTTRKVSDALNAVARSGDYASGANFTAQVSALTETLGAASVQSAGAVTAFSATAIPAGGTTGSGLKVSSTSNFGIFFGSGAPTLSAAKGSLYLRSDGSSTSTRAYINTDGATTWTAITTAA